jgi:hypothetical protein
MLKFKLLGFNTKSRKSSISNIRSIFEKRGAQAAVSQSGESGPTPLALDDIVLAVSKKVKGRRSDCDDPSESDQPAAHVMAHGEARQADKVADTDLLRLQRALAMFSARLSA